MWLILVWDVMEKALEKLPLVGAGKGLDEARRVFASTGWDRVAVVDGDLRVVGEMSRAALEGAGRGRLPMEEPANVVREEANAESLIPLFEVKRAPIAYVVNGEGRLVGYVVSDSPGVRAFIKSKEILPYANIFDAMYDAILVMDRNGRIVFVNHAYSRIVGVPIRKVLGKKLEDIEPGARCLEVLRTQIPVVNQHVRIRSVGVNVVSNITPIYKDGEFVGVVSVFRNPVEVLELSKELQRMRDVARYLQHELERKSEFPPSFDSVIGNNSRFREALALAAKVAPADTSIIIRGENGVGKEVLAKAIHNASDRRDKPLVRVNCAAIPDTLLESELFGYEEGAFTGARRGGKAGKFELAHQGTIFLDEVGDMSPTMQAKLLRVIQEKEFERVGGNQTIKVDVRIISATNKDLETMVKERSFREDLYYRLNVVPVFLPPLRERKDDLPLLVDYFLNRYSQQHGKSGLTVSRAVMDIFMRHSWSGNIRELQNALEHAVLVCAARSIAPEHLPKYFLNLETDPGEGVSTAEYGAGKLPDLVSRVEKEAILRALRACRNNKTRAMKTLGISRRTFYEKLKKYQIEA